MTRECCWIDAVNRSNLKRTKFDIIYEGEPVDVFSFFIDFRFLAWLCPVCLSQNIVYSHVHQS